MREAAMRFKNKLAYHAESGNLGANKAVDKARSGHATPIFEDT